MKKINALIDGLKYLKTNKIMKERLDCPYDFTSRCTMGRCDCKPKEERMYSKEDLREAYFSAIKSTGEGWNGEYANGNNPDIKKKFNEGFEEWFEQFKNK
jgi:hypothetical protein